MSHVFDFFCGLIVGWGACVLTFTFVAARWPGFFSGGSNRGD